MLKRILSVLLIIGCVCCMSAKGESMYRSRGFSGDIIEWNGHVIVVSMTKHLFSKLYRLFVVTPAECRCIMHKEVRSNEVLDYYSSNDIITERCVGTAAPLSYSTIYIKYSYCKASDTAGLRKENFTELPVEKNETINTTGGAILKYCDDHTLSRLNTNSGIWETLAVENDGLEDRSGFFHETCICFSKPEGLYYSPESDAVYQFPAAKGAVPYSFVLYKDQLIYAEDGGIYACGKNNDVPVRIVSSGAGSDIRRTTDFCIADDILYVCNFQRNHLMRVRLDNYEVLPALEIDYVSNTCFLIHNGYLYLIKENRESVEYISIIDLESGTEVKRHLIG